MTTRMTAYTDGSVYVVEVLGEVGWIDLCETATEAGARKTIEHRQAARDQFGRPQWPASRYRIRRFDHVSTIDV